MRSRGTRWSRRREGDIFVQKSVLIAPDDTVLTLNSKCFEAGYAGFEDLIAAIETNTLGTRRQHLGDRSYFARSRKPPAGATVDLSLRPRIA